MSEEAAAAVQVVLALFSLLVAVAAVMVARGAKDVAADSVNVARQSAETARRATALADVPILVAERPTPNWQENRLEIAFHVDGNVPALRVVAHVMGCQR